MPAAPFDLQMLGEVQGGRVPWYPAVSALRVQGTSAGKATVYRWVEVAQPDSEARVWIVLGVRGPEASCGPVKNRKAAEHPSPRHPKPENESDSTSIFSMQLIINNEFPAAIKCQQIWVTGRWITDR